MRALWPHQRDCLASLERSSNPRGLVVIPTGGGKSEIERITTLSWLAASASHRAVIAVPNRTLAFQHRAGFYLHNPSSIVPTLCMQGYPVARGSKIIVSTYQSLRSVIDYFDSISQRFRDILLIADECHHCNIDAPVFYDAVMRFPRRIGFSATPWTNGCQGLFDNNFYYFLGITDAINRGIIADYRIELRSSLKADPSKAYQMHFVHRIPEADRRVLRNAVYCEDPISQYRPQRNDIIVEKFRAGEISCLYVNRMLLEGFDCPKVKLIYISKKTDSELLLYQMIGRGLRRYNNETLTVFVDSEHSLTMLESVRQWAEEAEGDLWLRGK